MSPVIVAGRVGFAVEQDRRWLALPSTDDVSIAVGENSQVEQGDLLFQLDPMPYQLTVRQGQADFALGQAARKTQRRLLPTQRSSVVVAGERGRACRLQPGTGDPHRLPAGCARSRPRAMCRASSSIRPRPPLGTRRRRFNRPRSRDLPTEHEPMRPRDRAGLGLLPLLGGCAFALWMAPQRPDQPWHPSVTATGVAIAGSPDHGQATRDYVLPANPDIAGLTPRLRPTRPSSTHSRNSSTTPSRTFRGRGSRGTTPAGPLLPKALTCRRSPPPRSEATRPATDAMPPPAALRSAAARPAARSRPSRCNGCCSISASAARSSMPPSSNR